MDTYIMNKKYPYSEQKSVDNPGQLAEMRPRQDVSMSRDRDVETETTSLI